MISSENFGQKHPAAWPLNLDADPAAKVQVGAEIVSCAAKRLTDDEADRYWPRLVQAWPAHATYRRRSGERHTFVLTLADSQHCARPRGERPQLRAGALRETEASSRGRPRCFCFRPEPACETVSFTVAATTR